MAERTNGFRFPITAIAVVGLGALVALAVGVSLYLGLSSATENTRRLMAQRSETLVSDLERRITSQLRPVVQQARWAVEQIERGNVTLEDTQALNTFIHGGLGAMPQVAGIAITDAQALNRRWRGSSVQPLVEDWSDSPTVAAWLEAGASLTGPRWQAPFWTSTLGTTILLLDTPIRIGGEFAGLFSQAVTISDLSLHIASIGSETGIIPFILYDRDHVLAHPLLIIPAVSSRVQSARRAGSATPYTVMRSIWRPGWKPSTRNSARALSSSPRRPRHRWKASTSRRWARSASVARPGEWRSTRSAAATVEHEVQAVRSAAAALDANLQIPTE